MDAVSTRPERAGKTRGYWSSARAGPIEWYCPPGSVASERHGHGQKSQPQIRREQGIDILSSSLPLFFTSSHWPVGSQRAWTREVSPMGHKAGQRRRKMSGGGESEGNNTVGTTGKILPSLGTKVYIGCVTDAAS